MTNFGVPANDPVLSRPWSKYQPWRATIVAQRPIDEDAGLVSIELEADDRLDHDPGQFVQAIVPGVGEAPLAITTPPEETGSYELLVRDVGSVTNALLGLESGEEIGVRGPYGDGFDAEGLVGNDLVFVANGDGLASLRPMIERAADRPEEYGDVTICYGDSSPDALLYEERLGEWSDREHVTVRTAVESAPPGTTWEGRVGTVEDLVSSVTFDPRRTDALIAGEHGTITPVLDVLEEKRLPDDRILISLEARMRCGVGVCGNCRFDGLSVCRNGPVFDYRTVKPRVDTL